MTEATETLPIRSPAPSISTSVSVCSLSGGPAQIRLCVLHILGALFPLIAGDFLYGWRVPATLAVVLLAVIGATMIWKQIGVRGAAIHLPYAIWLAVLLTLMLPPHLLVGRDATILKIESELWLLPPAAALMLVMLMWLFGTGSFPRIFPLLLTYLALVIFFGIAIFPHLVLHRSDVFFGDLADVNWDKPISTQVSREEAWIKLKGRPTKTALFLDRTAAERLSQYTRAAITPQHEVVSIDGLLRSALPPLEDLVIGGHPGPIGTSSAIAVIIGGLFLLYRNLIDYRVPLIAVMAAFVAYLILPIPVLITDMTTQWRSLALSHLDWPLITTFANYEIMASPFLFAVFFIATAPTLCPNATGRVKIYAMLLGVVSAVCQLYLSVAWGPYVAILVVGLIIRLLDPSFSESAEPSIKNA